MDIEPTVIELKENYVVKAIAVPKKYHMPDKNTKLQRSGSLKVIG